MQIGYSSSCWDALDAFTPQASRVFVNSFLRYHTPRFSKIDSPPSARCRVPPKSRCPTSKELRGDALARLFQPKKHRLLLAPPSLAKNGGHRSQQSRGRGGLSSASCRIHEHGCRPSSTRCAGRLRCCGLLELRVMRDICWLSMGRVIKQTWANGGCGSYWLNDVHQRRRAIGEAYLTTGSSFCLTS